MEFNIDVGRTRIVEILNSNGYKYRLQKLKIKNELLHQNLRLNWCERHIIETCFPDLFFSYESTFYLDNPIGARWIKSKITIYMQNLKEENGAWTAISSRGKTSLYLYEQNMNTQNYLKVLEEAIEEMKELRDISRDVLFLQIDNARYHWSIEALEFYYEINKKNYWLATVFSRLKSNRKYLGYYEEKDCWKNFYNNK